MKICMVTMHACIRVFKYAWTLKHQTDHEIYLMADRESMGWNIYDNFSRYINKQMFQSQIKMYDKFVDIFHVHNEPDTLVTWVREVSDKPIIYDCHDLQSMRTCVDPDIDELSAFELADYVIHVSEPIAKQATETHGEHDHSIIYSYVNHKFFPKELGDTRFDSICYEGGLSDQLHEGGLFNYRWMLPLAQEGAKQGYNVTFYSAHSTADYPNLLASDAVVHKNLVYPMLLRALQNHALGFVGACIVTPIMLNAVPNKLFEYISQGVVPVVCNAEEAWNRIKDHKIGVQLSAWENLKEQIGDVKKLRKKLDKERWNFVFEKQLPEILEIYEKVLS